MKGFWSEYGKIKQFWIQHWTGRECKWDMLEKGTQTKKGEGRDEDDREVTSWQGSVGDSSGGGHQNTTKWRYRHLSWKRILVKQNYWKYY